MRPARWVIIALCWCVGCGPQFGTVTGTVMYREQPIPVGTVTFYGAQNQVAFAEIAADGSYQMDRVPIGPVKVSVETPNVAPFVLQPGQPPPPPGLLSPAYRLPNVKIPARYRDRRTSGLELTVRAGTQEFPIVLRDDESPGSAAGPKTGKPQF